MTLEEAKKVIQETRSFIGTIYSQQVVLDGPFNPQEPEASKQMESNAVNREMTATSVSGGLKARHSGDGARI